MYEKQKVSVYYYLYKLGLEDKFNSYYNFCQNADELVKNVDKGSRIKTLFILPYSLQLNK